MTFSVMPLVYGVMTKWQIWWRWRTRRVDEELNWQWLVEFFHGKICPDNLSKISQTCPDSGTGSLKKLANLVRMPKNPKSCPDSDLSSWPIFRSPGSSYRLMDSEKRTLDLELLTLTFHIRGHWLSQCQMTANDPHWTLAWTSWTLLNIAQTFIIPDHIINTPPQECASVC